MQVTAPHERCIALAKTLVQGLVEYFPTPVDDWIWFQVPNTGIAVSLPESWRIDMDLDMKDWSES